MADHSRPLHRHSRPSLSSFLRRQESIPPEHSPPPSPSPFPIPRTGVPRGNPPRCEDSVRPELVEGSLERNGGGPRLSNPPPPLTHHSRPLHRHSHGGGNPSLLNNHLHPSNPSLPRCGDSVRPELVEGSLERNGGGPRLSNPPPPLTRHSRPLHRHSHGGGNPSLLNNHLHPSNPSLPRCGGSVRPEFVEGSLERNGGGPRLSNPPPPLNPPFPSSRGESIPGGVGQGGPHPPHPKKSPQNCPFYLLTSMF